MGLKLGYKEIYAVIPINRKHRPGERKHRKPYLFVTFTSVLLGTLLLASCKSESAPLALIDRAAVIDALPSELYSETAASTNNEVTIILDRSASMKGFAGNGSLYEAVVNSISVDSRQIGRFRGVFMDGDLASSEDVVTDSMSFKERIFSSDTYLNSDESRIAENIGEQIQSVGIKSNQLFVFLTDLSTTERAESANPLASFAEALSPFVQSRTKNVAVISLKSAYIGNLYNMPKLDVKGLAPGDIGTLSGESQQIEGKHLNRGAGVDAPVYIILFGDAAMLDAYLDSIYSKLVAYDNNKYDVFCLDSFPESKQELPVAQMLDELVNPVRFDEEASRFILPIPESADAMDKFFAPLPSDNKGGGSWNRFIVNRGIPLFRMYGDGNGSDRYEEFSNYMSKYQYLPISITFEQSDAEVDVDVSKILVTKFIADYVDANGVQVEYEYDADFDENAKNYADKSGTEDSAEQYIRQRTEVAKANADIVDLTVKRDGTAVSVNFLLNCNIFSLNAPVLFKVEIPLSKTLEWNTYAPRYTPTGSSDPKWGELEFDIAEFMRQTYKWDGNDSDGKTGYYFSVNSSYTLYDRTRGISQMLRTLFYQREAFISENTQREVNSDVVQHVLFGLVLRGEYDAEVSGRTKSGDNGGYAFSEDEVSLILDGPEDDLDDTDE